MKFVRLALAACITAVLCTAYFYLVEPRQLYQAYRCITGARPWYACYIRNQFDFTTDLFGMVYEGNTGNTVDAWILNYGSYETQVLYFLRDIMRDTYSNEGVFLDVGANTGQHSMFMSRYAKEVHAFEPYAPVRGRFQRMIAVNRITNVMVYPVGLGSENKKLRFYKPPETNLGTGSFVEGMISGNGDHEELDIVAGDAVLKKANVGSVQLIKMDIEGFERPALKGLAVTLAQSRPIVVFELAIDPKQPILFKSKKDIQGVFPDRYEFLVFKFWDFYTGFYELTDLDALVRFDVPSHYNAVAYPIEKKGHIPLTNRR